MRGLRIGGTTTATWYSKSVKTDKKPSFVSKYYMAQIFFYPLLENTLFFFVSSTVSVVGVGPSLLNTHLNGLLSPEGHTVLWGAVGAFSVGRRPDK